jgi:peptidoglycan/LPS O-acetylase OafA/YrhL
VYQAYAISYKSCCSARVPVTQSVITRVILMPIHSTSTKKLKTIQVFRGVAAMLVVLAHADLIFNQNLNQDFLFKVFNFGGSGVDFFFVLSGFIILYVHQSDIGNKNKLKLFFIKRFTRIYPIYWVILTLKLSASLFFFYDPDTNQRSLGEIVKAFLLFPQDRTILSSSFLGVSWTLSYEIFFYLVFGVLIFFKPKFSLPIITILIVGTILNFIGVFNIPKDSFLLKFIFDEHNLEFALGCLAAHLLLKKVIKFKYGIFLVSVGAFIYTLFAINEYYGFIELSSVISFGIPSTFLVIGSASLEMKNLIKVPYILIHVGNASYSIYLMHGFVINNLTKMLIKLNQPITQNLMLLNVFGVCIAIIAIIFGCVVYFYIEKPLLSVLKPRVATT